VRELGSVLIFEAVAMQVALHKFGSDLRCVCHVCVWRVCVTCACVCVCARVSADLRDSSYATMCWLQ